MQRKVGLGLVALGIVAVLVLAACGGSGHTYVVTPTSPLAAGVYLTIVSPSPLPQGLLDKMKKGLTFVELAQGPEICKYSKQLNGLTGKYASLNGETLTLKVNGSSRFIGLICSGLEHQAFNPTSFASSPAKHKKRPRGISSIGPLLMSPSQLKAESKTLGTPIYWAGPQRGYRYEFTRSRVGYLYVRYLPHGVPAGKQGANWLVVSTYPFVGGYHGLETAAHGSALRGPAGSIYLVNPGFHSSVLVAWPGVDYQVEIYDPKPVISATIASSGRVQPVG